MYVNLLSKLNIEIKRKFAADLESTGNSSTVAVKREKKRKDAVDVETVRSVEDFFNQEDISINVPNKKAVNKDGINKLVLRTSYEDCFLKCKEREPAKNIVLNICPT